MKPKKLIREKITSKLKEGEFENITDLTELNKLYAIKVREELAEIQESDHKDIMEFVDLIQVAVCFAEQNGFSHEQIELSANIKYVEKGKFSNLVLNNLNPENPSNKLYFEKVEQKQDWIYTKDSTPNAYQTGSWDGKKSDEVIAEDKDGTRYLAHVYQGFLDGSNFLDWYSDNDYMIENVVRWFPIPL